MGFIDTRINPIIETKELAESPEFIEMNETLNALKGGMMSVSMATTAQEFTDALAANINTFQATENGTYANGQVVAGVDFTTHSVFFYSIGGVWSQEVKKIQGDPANMDLTTAPGNNIYNYAIDTPDFFINNFGVKTGNVGAEMAKIILDSEQADIAFKLVKDPSQAVNKYYAFYDASDVLIPGAFGLANSLANPTAPVTVAIPAGAAAVYFTSKNAAEVDTIRAQHMVNYGTVALPFEPYEEKIIEINGIGFPYAKKDDVYTKDQTNALLPDISTITAPSKNLLKAVNRYSGLYISTVVNAGFVAAANWKIWLFPIDAITPMTISGWNSPQTALAFLSTPMPTSAPPVGSAGIVLSGPSNSIGLGSKSGGVLTFTPPVGSVWGAILIASASDADALWSQIQIEVGSNATGYESGDSGETVAEKINNNNLSAKYMSDSAGNIMSLDQIVSRINNSVNTLSYSLTPAGLLTLNYAAGTLTANTKNNRGFTRNNEFTFATAALAGQSFSQEDDSAPMHIYGTTLGGNHGFPHLCPATITAHGLTNANIGQEWSTAGGVKFYVMRIIDANTVQFMSENSGTSTSPIWTILSTGTLTSGANTLNVTAVSATVQMYQSIKNLSIKVLKNGVTDITGGDTGSAGFLDVVETYEIKDPVSILATTIARLGQSKEQDYAGDGAVLVKNIYRFTPDMTCFVIANTRFLKAAALQDIMISQAGIVGGLLDGVAYHMVPNSAVTGGYDFKVPVQVPWSGSVPPIIFNVASSPDPANPPNRVVMYRGNLGFQLAYLRTKGVGKAPATYTARMFQLWSSTGKVYPYPIDGGVVGGTSAAGDEYNTVMVRSFCDLTKVRTGNRLSMFVGDLQGETYIWLDYSGSMTDIVDLSRVDLNGKTIEVIESKNVALVTDVYNWSLTVKATFTSGQSCFSVLRIK